MENSIRDFARTYELNQKGPVSLRLLHDYFDIRKLPLSAALMGFVLRYRHDLIVGINENLHPFEQRMVLCHELSHFAIGHPDSFYLCKYASWSYQKLEMEAQRGSAIMLLPKNPVLRMAKQGASIREITDAFEAPADLVHLRLRMEGIL